MLSLANVNLYSYAKMLINTGKEQCFNDMFINDKCCALGVLVLELKKDLSDIDITKPTIQTCHDFRKATGLSITEVNDIKRWSFARIGEYLLCSLLPL